MPSIRALVPADPVERALTAASIGVALSSGVFYAVSALYFTRVVGLQATTVGLGLTLGGAVGVATSYLGGRLSDRWGADRVLAGAIALQGLGLLAYSFVEGVAGFIVVACCVVALRGIAGTGRAALQARWFVGAERVAVRARLRVVMNLGMGVGTALAGIALLVDTEAAYRSAMVAVALAELLASVPLARLRSRVPDLAGRAAARRPAESSTSPPGRSPWRDRTYLSIVGLNAVMAMQFGLLTVGMPLWVVIHTSAPPVMVSVLLVLNTLGVALLQVRASRGTHDVRVAGRVVRRAGFLLALACALYAVSGTVGPVVAIALLLGAGIISTGAEVWGEAGSWGLAFELADPVNVGAYQGVSQIGYSLAAMLSPLVVTATAIDQGSWGWASLAIVFICAGMGVSALARRAAVGSAASRLSCENSSASMSKTTLAVRRTGESATEQRWTSTVEE